MCKPQMHGRPMTIIYLPQLRVASTSRYAFGKIFFLSWSPWQTIHAPRRLSTLFLMLIMNSHYLVDCHFFALFCSDISRATIHDVHRIPYSQRAASWVGVAFRMLCKAPTMLCSSFWGHWKLIYSSTGTRQVKRASRFKWAHKKLCDLFYTNWGKLLGPHSLPVSSWPAGTWHKIMEVDSTLVLPWERRSASKQQVYGVKPCAYTIITPTTQILYLVSIGQYHVPLHLLV
jgi:hypothetical protein